MITSSLHYTTFPHLDKKTYRSLADAFQQLFREPGAPDNGAADRIKPHLPDDMPPMFHFDTLDDLLPDLCRYPAEYTFHVDVTKLMFPDDGEFLSEQVDSLDFDRRGLLSWLIENVLYTPNSIDLMYSPRAGKWRYTIILPCERAWDEPDASLRIEIS